MERTSLPYWDAAARGWAPAPPLSPSADDLRWYQSWAERVRWRPGVVLLLGVTPGLARLTLAPGATLVAMDWSEPMLRGTCPPGHPRLRADWREAPLASTQVALVLGDGCYSALGDVDGARLMNRQMHRVLGPGGVACLRCFVRPARNPSPRALAEEAREGPPMRFDLFRWRLAMSVHGDHRWGVALGEVWDAWDGLRERGALVARQGWSAAEVDRLERWKGATARYSFASLDELAEVAAPWFEILERAHGAQPLDECFPRLAMRARPTAKEAGR
jgi:SAM-dependent methyltransferase